MSESRETELIEAIIENLDDSKTEYTKTPQSRNEEILVSILNETEYTKTPQSREEELLLELKEKIGGLVPPVPPVIKRVTGNPIEFTDGADAPLVKCVTQITGSQDLHGYDKPWVGGAGKNKFDSSILSGATSTNQTETITLTPNTTYTMSTNKSVTGSGAEVFFYLPGESPSTSVNGVTSTTPRTLTTGANGNITILYKTYGDTLTDYNWQIEQGSTATTFEPYSNICPITAYTEGEVEVSGRNLCNQVDKTTSGSGYVIGTNAPDYINTDHTVFPAGTYTFSFNVSGATSGSQAQVIFYRDDTHPVGSKTGSVGTAGRKPYTITATKPFAKMQLYCNSSSGGQFTDFQLERGDTLHDYEEYITPTTHSTTFPSAIYRGSEDVVNGEVTEEWITADPTTVGTLTHNGISSESSHFIWRDTTAPKKNGKENFITNAFEVIQSGDVVNCVVGRENSDAIEFLLPISIGSSVADAKTYLSTYSTVIAYELATHTTSSVTPTNLPIKSLSGYNHIESSTGDMTIDYITDAYQNFVDTVESALPNTTRKGVLLSTRMNEVTAMDIFLSLDNPKTPDQEKVDEIQNGVKEETIDDRR